MNMKLAAIVCIALLMSGCGKTLDQLKAAAHNIIEIAGKVYEDSVDNATTVKETAKEIVTPSEPK